MPNSILHFRILLLTVLLALAGCADAAPKPSFADQFASAKPTAEKAIDFDKSPAGKPPEAFTPALTGEGPAPAWAVQPESAASAAKGVLAQTSADESDYRFPHCILKDFSGKDVDVSVRFKAISGKVDQAGGLIVRYQDKDNYYVVRANALEDNIRLYRVIKGDRQQFAGVSAKVEPATWHTLRLCVKGGHFQVFFNDKPLFEADDDAFKNAGGIGLWTKADSVTHFDHLIVRNFDSK